MLRDSYYSSGVSTFLSESDDSILGTLARANHHALEHAQRSAWIEQIGLLKRELAAGGDGKIFLEFLIPRMGKRADVVLLRGGVVYVVEFKTFAKSFDRYAMDQVFDYALDLKNFHLGSHHLPIVPILCATRSKDPPELIASWADDDVCSPLKVGGSGLAQALQITPPKNSPVFVDANGWRTSGYRPTPTIIQAAEALYRGHSVEQISRSAAGEKNLRSTQERIAQIVDESKEKCLKSICFLTGVPGAGKTLAGLNIAAKRAQKFEDENAVFLSGNGPLVDVLREALARDQAERLGETKANAMRSVRQFIQNIHHFRDHYLQQIGAPFEKVVVFDEAQRAWTKDQASKFMMSKRGLSDFAMSEPEFLISVMDRHSDWCTVICLIGGGQEINTGEAGLSEWLEAVSSKFPHWKVHASSLLNDPHYTIDTSARRYLQSSTIQKHSDLHLSVAMRSFRSEKLSDFVSFLLEGQASLAKSALDSLKGKFPVVVTREVEVARDWLRHRARGTERYGLVASSGGQRLRPEGVHVKAKIDPRMWFLNDKSDVRSSYYLEEVASQFDVQGLELDWVGLCWDLDLNRSGAEWGFSAFKGTKWQAVRDIRNQTYVLNAYRVLLTRARQGMVIFVPKGSRDDETRPPQAYDGIYQYLLECGASELDRA